MLASLAGRGGLGFVVADRLAEHVRRELEEAGCAYADGTGAAHIDVPGFFLHIQGKPPRSLTSVPGPPGIGVTGVRVIQVLLTDAERHWSVADLEREAACSRGEAHRVVTRLEREGFLEAHGRARTLRRVVADPGGLLDWLSTVPSARRIRERLHASAYATSPAALVTTISLHASKADLVYAFTGAAAAHVYGVTATTSVSVTMIRVAPDVPLLNACSVLQAEPVDRGANIMLVRDFGMVGVHARQFCGPPSVASPVRVWLDMLDEPRGEDAAALFREAVIGW
ncbi:MAG TPA: helix-turn-helix domain-containing protein [Streptosporangiaceae bacterium]|nr:helix-turn-helix domain-containing protein [Streptosporangiaceae bacterium]